MNIFHALYKSCNIYICTSDNAITQNDTQKSERKKKIQNDMKNKEN